MPPKSGKGGKKLSKSEKERLKKEEAEKKAEDDEVARVQAEKDAVLKSERDKVEAEERKRLEHEECKKRKGQLQELEELWSSYRNTLHNQRAEVRRKDKWDRYMRCDGSPDPTIPGEINTYMNLLREDHSGDDIKSVLKESQMILTLISELEHLMFHTPPEEAMETEFTRYKRTVKELQDLLQEKLDLASHDLSLKATDLRDPETTNLQKVISGDEIVLCMWGNLSKNPRIKSFEFEEKGFQFEMSKLLTLSDIAFRVMFTRFDHYSPYNKSYQLRIKSKVVEEPTSVTEEGADGEKAEGEQDGEKKEGEGEEGVSREETEQSLEVEDEIQTQDPQDPPEDGDVMAALRDLEEGTEEEEGGAEQEVVEEEPEVEDYEIKSPEPILYEDFDGDDEVIDLRAFHVVGGIFHFNLINLPPQPKQAKSWEISQVVAPPAMSFSDYEGDPPQETPKEEEKSEDITKAADKLLSMKMDMKKDDEEPKKKAEEKPPIPVTYKKDDKPPIGVQLKIPSDVTFFEDPQVVRWNADSREWKTSGFTDIIFKEEERLLNFKTRFFGTMALIQDKHINMPFQSWEMRPKAANHVVFTIIAAIIEVEMEVKDDKVCLTQPDDRPELGHIRGKWMDIHDFIKAMQLAGVNLFPDDDSSKYVSIQNKPAQLAQPMRDGKPKRKWEPHIRGDMCNSITEERLYQQMAMVASAMAFSWSRWNSDCKDMEKLVIQANEQLQDEPLLEEEWSLFMVSKKRTTKLKMTEFDETFSEDYAEGTEFHADLYHMFMDIATEDGRARVRETNHLFVDSIYQILKSTNIVTYS